MEEFAYMFKPWVLIIGAALLIVGVIFAVIPAIAIALNNTLDRSVDIEKKIKKLETKVFNIDRWIIKHIRWLGVVAISDAVILLAMYYLYIR